MVIGGTAIGSRVLRLLPSAAERVCMAINPTAPIAPTCGAG